jgi:hypothetical protein
MIVKGVRQTDENATGQHTSENTAMKMDETERETSAQVKRPESDPIGFYTFREIPMVGARSDPNVGIRCGPHTSDDFR